MTSPYRLLALLLVVGCTGKNDPARDDGDIDGGDSLPTDSDPTDDDPRSCLGTAASIAVGGAQTLEALAEDPDRCRIYGLDRTGSEVYFIDTHNDVLARTVAVGTEPVDLTLSADKRFLYVAVYVDKKIVKLDAATGEILASVDTALWPYRIARGVDDRVFYVEEDVFAAVRQVNFGDSSDTALTGVDYHEPDLDASPDGKSLYLGESSQPGSRLFRLDGESPTLAVLDEYRFDGGFTLPSPERRIHLGKNNRVYFADRAFAADDLVRMRGWLSEQVVTTTPDGNVVASDESIFDGQTFLRIATRLHRGGGALFSSDGYWFYEFEADGSRLYRTQVSALLGTHQLGETSIPPGTLAQRRFNQLLADPTRPVIYALDSQKNTIVYISTESLLPVRAEVIGSAPTDMAISADGSEMMVATFGATEVAVLDLNDATKALKQVLHVTGNPFKITVNPAGRIVYAEQDQFCDVTLLDRTTGTVLSSTEPNSVFQPDVDFDSTGQYLFAGEAFGAQVYLRKFDISSGQLLEVASTEEGYAYPSRRVIFKDGFVYYAGRKFNATENDTGHLAELHDFNDEIVVISPNGRFAISRHKVFDLSQENHPQVAGLPVDSDIMTVSPDSALLYQFDDDTGALFVQALPSD